MEIPQNQNVRVAREYAAVAIFACPSCGHRVDTENGIPVSIDAAGARFVGVPCLGCGQSYTVDIS